MLPRGRTYKLILPLVLPSPVTLEIFCLIVIRELKLSLSLIPLQLMPTWPYMRVHCNENNQQYNYVPVPIISLRTSEDFQLLLTHTADPSHPLYHPHPASQYSQYYKPKHENLSNSIVKGEGILVSPIRIVLHLPPVPQKTLLHLHHLSP